MLISAQRQEFNKQLLRTRAQASKRSINTTELVLLSAVCLIITFLYCKSRTPAVFFISQIERCLYFKKNTQILRILCFKSHKFSNNRPRSASRQGVTHKQTLPLSAVYEMERPRLPPVHLYKKGLHKKKTALQGEDEYSSTNVCVYLIKRIELQYVRREQCLKERPYISLYVRHGWRQTGRDGEEGGRGLAHILLGQERKRAIYHLYAALA